jgi:hypothetical protein
MERFDDELKLIDVVMLLFWCESGEWKVWRRIGDVSLRLDRSSRVSSLHYQYSPNHFVFDFLQV